MKILLINPSYSSNVPLSMAFGEPLGLAYVAAAVEKSGRHEVEILDGLGLADHYEDGHHRRWLGISHDEMLERTRSMRFDAVGITMTRMYNAELHVNKLAARLRAMYPKKPIIVGGPEITQRYEQYIHDPNLDFLVLGEGETTIGELLDHLEGRRDRATLKGVAYRDDTGKVVVTPAQDIADIDQIGWPARHLLPMDTYFRFKTKYSRTPAASILTSRACPYSCAFCSSIHVWGRKWRARSAEDVVNEIEHLVRDLGVREIRIQDDNFSVDRARAEAICDGIVERGLDIALHIEPGVMIHLATKSLLAKLRKAGLFTLTMQMESGGEKAQAYINKKIRMEHAREMVAHARELGLTTTTNILIGFFFETREDMEQSALNAIECGYDTINFIYPEPLERTRLRADCIAAGVLKEGEAYTLPLPTQHATAEEVAGVVTWAREEFNRRRHNRVPPFDYAVPTDAIRAEEGHCWTVALPDSTPEGDGMGNGQRSAVCLYEDDKPLGPAHSSHADIRGEGGGRYSHWNRTLYFSTSDNSNPHSNGRAYRLGK